MERIAAPKLITRWRELLGILGSPINLAGLTLVPIIVGLALAKDIPSQLVTMLATISYSATVFISKKILSYVLFVVLMLTSAWGLIEVVFGYSPIAWTQNQNVFGYLGVILLSFSMGRRNWAGVVMGLVSIITSACTGAVLAAIVGFAIYSWRNGKRLYVLFLALACIPFLIANGTHTIQIRLAEWLVTIQALAAQTNLIGATVVQSPYALTHHHNIILQAMTGLGIIPGSAAIGLGGSVCYRLLQRKDINTSIMVGWLLVGGAVDYLFWVPFIAPIIFCWIALVGSDSAR